MKFPAKLGFTSSRSPCDSSLLIEFERSLPQNKLPPEYRNFLMEWNGGDFDLVAWRGEHFIGSNLDIGVLVPGQKHLEDDFPVYIGELYGLFDPNSSYDLRRSGIAYGFEKAVPSNYLAIGGSSSDTGIVCISIDGDDFGKVYYWCGEPWEVSTSPNVEYMSFVAHDFQAFWSMICILNFETGERYTERI